MTLFAELTYSIQLLKSCCFNLKPIRFLVRQEFSSEITTACFVFTGRTFPTHPYFSAQLGAGQLSLYNILKAYSLLDQEVGYCQGLSFVAGILLLHMGEEEAFHMLKFLMFDRGLRKQYRPDMIILQVDAPYVFDGDTCRNVYDSFPGVAKDLLLTSF